MRALWAAVALAVAWVATRWDPIGCEAWDPPLPLPTLEVNRRVLEHGEKVLVGKVLGPESLTLHRESGMVYTGLHTGEIVRFKPDSPDESLEPFLWLNSSCRGLPRAKEYKDADPSLEPLCGRPLGIKFHPTRQDELYVVEAYTGLLRIDLTTRDQTVLHRGSKLANDLDIDPNTDEIFFTESSPRWGRNKIILEILSGRRTGKLLKWDPILERSQVLQDHLPLTNGVCLSHDKSVVYFIAGPAVHGFHRTSNSYLGIILNNLPCVPDNIRRHPSDNKSYLIACSARRAQPFSLIDALAPYPLLREVLLFLIDYSQLTVLKLVPVHSQVHRIVLTGDAPGLISSVQDPTGSFGYFSEAEKFGEWLFVGSWKEQWLTRIPWQSTPFGQDV
jgi:hypothetical protein